MFEVNEHGLTCLHYAVFGSSLPVMRYLVDQCGFDLSLSAAVSCRVIHDRVIHSLRRFVFDVQYVYSRFRQCYAHALQYILHTRSHIHPHTSYMYHTHTHIPHKLTTHYNSKQFPAAIVHTHMQPKSPPISTEFIYIQLICTSCWLCTVLTMSHPILRVVLPH